MPPRLRVLFLIVTAGLAGIGVLWALSGLAGLACAPPGLGICPLPQ
jgi:hypothetical protein